MDKFVILKKKAPSDSQDSSKSAPPKKDVKKEKEETKSATKRKEPESDTKKTSTKKIKKEEGAAPKTKAKKEKTEEKPKETKKKAEKKSSSSKIVENDDDEDDFVKEEPKTPKTTTKVSKTPSPSTKTTKPSPKSTSETKKSPKNKKESLVEFVPHEKVTPKREDSKTIKTTPTNKKTPSPLKRKASIVKDDVDDFDMLDAEEPKKKPEVKKESPAAKAIPAKKYDSDDYEMVDVSEQESKPKIPTKSSSTKTTPTKKAAESPSKEPSLGKKKASSSYFEYKNRPPPPLKGMKEIPDGEPNCLYGKIFLLTGILDSLEREDAHDLIRKYGGAVAKTVTKKLTHLVVGTDPGQSKVAKAAENPAIVVITEDDLFNLIKTSSAKKLSKAEQEKAKNVILPPTQIKSPPKSKEEKKKSPSKGTKEEKEEAIAKAEEESFAEYQLWADKHKPQQTSQLVGNSTSINSLKNWLKAWKPTSEKKAALLSGRPGIGKTTTALLVARECGYDPLELNASDARSKKIITEKLSDITGGNRTLGEFFKKSVEKTTKTENTKKTVIIMDEVDGMSSGDRGGMTELIKLIRKTTTPIICICNDRMSPKVKSLMNYCLDLRFSKPTTASCEKRFIEIARKEGFSVEPLAMIKLLDSVQCDMRQALNLLQMWRRSSAVLKNSPDMKEKLDLASKNVAMNIWDVLPKIFAPQTTIPDKLQLYYMDSSFVPLMIQENYLSTGQQDIETIARAADSISESCVMDKLIHVSQQWELSNSYGILSTIRPAVIMKSNIAGQTRFTSWMGKNSTINKNKRLLKDIQIHSNGALTGDKSEIRLNYLSVLRRELLTPIVTNGKDAIPEVLELMDAYGLSRDDFDAIMDITSIGGEDPMVNVPKEVKAAFTRAYNKSHQLAKRTTKGGKEETEEDLEGEKQENDDKNLESEEEEEEEDIKNNKMIVVNKPKEEKVKRKGSETKKPAKKAKTTTTKKK